MRSKKLLIVIVIFLTLLRTLLSQEDTRYDAGMNLPFNEKAGEVNPQTGNITLSFTDMALPGRAGMNFSFGRIRSLNQSNVFNMFNREGINRLNSNTLEKYTRLGTGWSSTLPCIVENLDSSSLIISLFFGGSVYEIDQSTLGIDNPHLSNLLGYDLTDLRIYLSGAVNYGMFDSNDFDKTVAGLAAEYSLTDTVWDVSKYTVILKTNEKYRFRPDGRIMMQEDRSGLNKIWYFYETFQNESRLKLVVDTIGREIEFIYDDNGNLSTIEWEVTLGQKAEDGTRNRATEKRSIVYSYINGEDFTEIYQLKNEVLDYLTPYVLETVTNAMGHVVKYDYEAATADFTFNKTVSHSSNVYLLLTGITDQYTSEEGVEKYKGKRQFEYDVPARGMYTKWFYAGYMEYFKISRQYMVNRHGRVMNDAYYTYYDNMEAGNFNQYTAVIRSGNIKSTYTYSISPVKNRDNVLDTLLTETEDGFSELKDYVYNTDRTKALDDVYRLGKWVYSENYQYDNKGNLKRVEDKMGLLVQRTYDVKYSLPLTETKTLHDTDGFSVAYKTENVINDKGLVVKQIIYKTENGTERAIEASHMVYDDYGNVVSTTNALGQTSYMVYDEASHAFPVKIYQDVDIADWGTGTVHDNWEDDPAGTKRVRIRSWKVFNSDGSVWIEIDNEGYAIEHYYDANGQEREVINPDRDDERGFAEPIEIAGGTPAGTDFDDFTQSTYFNSFLASRENNPGARMVIDYQNDRVITYADIDKANGEVKVSGKQGDGLGLVEEEIEYTHPTPFVSPDDIQVYAVKKMDYDDYGRMVGLTDPDAEGGGVPVNVNGVTIQRYDKTWIVRYDDLGRQLKVLYPQTREDKTDIKVITYDDVNNRVTTIDPEGRKIGETYDWNGNLVELTRYGDTSTTLTRIEVITIHYDELKRKTSLIDAKGIETKYRYDEMNLLVEQDYGGESGSDFMVYNDLGQLIEKTDRKGQVIVFTYDDLGRNTSAVHYKSRGDVDAGTIDHTVSLAYDNRGNAVRVDNQNLIEHYIYDYANRVITLERKLKDGSLRSLIAGQVWGGDESEQVFSFNYIYNDAGMVKEMVYPDGSVHSFSYDGVLGRLTAIDENNTPFVTGFGYNLSGVVTGMEYANNTEQAWEFDNRKRISHITITGMDNENPGSAIPLADMNYTLNGVGDILKINENEYGYDGFDRIISARTMIPEGINQKDLKSLVKEHYGAFMDRIPINGRIYHREADLNNDGRINGKDHIIASFTGTAYDDEAFEYDKNGNRTRLVQNGDEYTYEYGPRNRLEGIRVKKAGEIADRLFTEYEYDANGNTITRTIYKEDNTIETIAFKYDTMNRLTKTIKGDGGEVSTTEYFYDNAGNRFIKKEGNRTSLYLRHGQIAVAMDIEIDEDSATDKGVINRYVLSGDLLAGRITSTTKSDDTKETERFWYHLDHLNSTKCVTKEDGTLEIIYEYRAFGEQLKRMDASGNETGDTAKYSYGGKELDDETNLYYFNARFYDATIGRFINVDPIQDGFNWYIYCNNNPLSFVDPTGLAPYDRHIATRKFKNINYEVLNEYCTVLKGDAKQTNQMKDGIGIGTGIVGNIPAAQMIAGIISLVSQFTPNNSEDVYYNVTGLLQSSSEYYKGDLSKAKFEIIEYKHIRNYTNYYGLLLDLGDHEITTSEYILRETTTGNSVVITDNDYLSKIINGPGISKREEFKTIVEKWNAKVLEAYEDPSSQDREYRKSLGSVKPVDEYIDSESRPNPMKVPSA